MLSNVKRVGGSRAAFQGLDLGDVAKANEFGVLGLLNVVHHATVDRDNEAFLVDQT